MNNLEVAKKFADHLEAHDLPGIEEILAEDLTAKGPTMNLNKQQTIDYLKTLFTAFPDISFNLTDFREVGDTVQCANFEQGTHTGVFDLTPFGIPLKVEPTGKSFKLPESTYIFRLENGRITYLEEKVPEGGGIPAMLAQLGIQFP